jgi:hypothetical protein
MEKSPAGKGRKTDGEEGRPATFCLESNCISIFDLHAGNRINANMESDHAETGDPGLLISTVYSHDLSRPV